MFWSLDSRGCIKAFLWGWFSTGASDQSIPRDLPTEHHVLALGGGWVQGSPALSSTDPLEVFCKEGSSGCRELGSQSS